VQYIHPDLDLPGLHKRFQRDGRVLALDFFEPMVAHALAAALVDVDWMLVHRAGGADQRHTGAALRGMTAQQRAALTQAIHAEAERDFQFSFFSHSLVHAAQRGETDLLTRFVRWMSDEPFLSVMRGISGLTEVNRLYAQATMYSRGNFLLTHDDHVDAEDRKLAYVINLTPQWRPDWGGVLHFTDASGNITESYSPHFNSISLFSVPQTHFVSYVPPFAGGERLAITGWLIAA